MLNKIKKQFQNRVINKINRQKENKKNGVILPLTYDHGLEVVVRLVKLKHKFLAKKWQYTGLIIFLVIISSGLIWFQKDYSAKGATYGWLQSTWSGGILSDQARCESANGTWDAVNSICVATHTDNQSGWTAYGSKDTEINTNNNEIKINLTTGSDTQTDDASGFGDWTFDNTYSTGTGIALKKNNGVDCGDNIQCTSGNCDADFSSGSYCHATASSCVYYAGGDPWELADGWEQCSGNDYYKSCNNSVWGSAVYPTNAYCDAGGGAQTGYLTSFICNSDMDGGFSSSCQSCSPYKANIDSCKNSCTSDADCWSTHFCTEGACIQCGDSFAYSGTTYPTVQIGTQCWLVKNLNVGAGIPVTSNQTNNDQIEKYCYNNSEANCTTYGGLYQWNEAMQYVTTAGARGICPAGWHIPTDAEQYTLENHLKDDGQTCSATRIGWDCATAGGKMKQTGTTLWASPNDGATNSSGFNALPAGARASGGFFLVIHEQTYFWSSSISGSNALNRVLIYSDANINRYANEQTAGVSVRCIKD